MAKPKKYDTSQDDPRAKAIDALLRNMTKGKMPETIRGLWMSLIRVWEASHDTRHSLATLFTPQEVVSEFIGRLERTMFLSLPAVLFKSLEGTLGKP